MITNRKMFGLSWKAAVLAALLSGCGGGGSSTSTSDDNVAPESEDNLPVETSLEQHPEYPVLQVAAGIVDPIVMVAPFDGAYELLNGLFTRNFPNSSDCAEARCEAAGIDSAVSAACAGSNPGKAYRYELADLAGFKLEFVQCELPQSSFATTAPRVLNGEISYRYLDAEGLRIEIAFDHYSITQAGVTRSSHGSIVAIDPADPSTQPYALTKTIDRLELATGDETIVITDFTSTATVSNNRYTLSNSMKIGSETRGLFDSTLASPIGGEMVAIGGVGTIAGTPSAGRFEFTRGTDTLVLQFAPGGDSSKVFVEINGENKVMTRQEFGAVSLLSFLN